MSRSPDHSGSNSSRPSGTPNFINTSSRRSSSNAADRAEGPATIIRDLAAWLPAVRNLKPTDVVVLLTPVVVPITRDPEDLRDPFEVFGRALASRHSKIRHVPYTNRNGVTSTHVGFLVRATVVVFVVCAGGGEASHVGFAEVARLVSQNRPLVIVVCCDPRDLLPLDQTFPTVIQSQGYSQASLESAAALMFGEVAREEAPARRIAGPATAQPRLWQVEEYDELRDIPGATALWNQCARLRFSLDSTAFASLLRRPGYGQHYVVRDAEADQILGFCATFLCYADGGGERLVASLALLVVRPSHQSQGVGLSLHECAIRELVRTRGIARIQLGSTFPRLLYGPSGEVDVNQEWLRRRGWRLDATTPGQGKAVYDLLLDFNDWKPTQDFQSMEDTSFRPCTQGDIAEVLRLVQDQPSQEGCMGWHDEYTKLADTDHVGDIMLALNKETKSIVAVALTYTSTGGGPVAADLPWAGHIGSEVGGITCICVSLPQRERLMSGILDACVQKLQEQRMTKMFLDGIIDGVDGYRQLGFQEWAQYKDVWRHT